jgi:hypothetical protein
MQNVKRLFQRIDLQYYCYNGGRHPSGRQPKLTSRDRFNVLIYNIIISTGTIEPGLTVSANAAAQSAAKPSHVVITERYSLCVSGHVWFQGLLNMPVN